MKRPEILAAASAAFVPSAFAPSESVGVIAKHSDQALVIDNRLIPIVVCAPQGIKELPDSPLLQGGRLGATQLQASLRPHRPQGRGGRPQCRHKNIAGRPGPAKAYSGLGADT